MKNWVCRSNEAYGFGMASPYLEALESEAPKELVPYTVRRRNRPSL